MCFSINPFLKIVITALGIQILIKDDTAMEGSFNILHFRE